MRRRTKKITSSKANFHQSDFLRELGVSLPPFIFSFFITFPFISRSELTKRMRTKEEERVGNEGRKGRKGERDAEDSRDEEMSRKIHEK